MKGIFEKKESFDIIAFITEGFDAFPPLFHPHCEFIYVIEGELRVTVDGMENTLLKDEAAIVFPYVTHSYLKAPNATAAVILFDPSLTYYEKLFYGNKPKNPFIKGISNLFVLIQKVCTFIKHSNPEIAKGAKAYLNALIAEVLPELVLEKSDAFEADMSKKVLEYCTEHFTENISIKTVSEALFISPSYVSKIFSKKLCYGFREYINLLRIDKAKKLLTNTDEKILDIMLDVGFDNQSSFNRIFMENVGLSPSEYRRSTFRG